MSKERDIRGTDEPQSPARRRFMKYAGAGALCAMTGVDNVVADSNMANKLRLHNPEAGSRGDRDVERYREV